MGETFGSLQSSGTRLSLRIDYHSHGVAMDKQNQQHLKAFEEKDLHKFIERYDIEKFVRRFLRTNGINTVGDLLALEEIELEEFVSRESHQVRKRTIDLYMALRKQRDKINARATSSRSRKKESVAPSSKTLADSKGTEEYTTTTTTPTDMNGEDTDLVTSKQFVTETVSSHKDV